MRTRHPGNASGDWYVDTTCTNCGAAQTVAPRLIVERDGQSVFLRQPETEDDLRQAWRARILCPSASVRTESHTKLAHPVFPEEMTERVYRLGYNAAASFGAHSFAFRHDTGTFMIDSPRWTQAVVDQLSAWDGLAGILLSHEDDVGDAQRYADHFHAPVWIHERDRAAAPFADKIIKETSLSPLPLGCLQFPYPVIRAAASAFFGTSVCSAAYSCRGISNATIFLRIGIIVGHGIDYVSRSPACRRSDFRVGPRRPWGKLSPVTGEMRERLTALIGRMKSQ